MKIENLRVLKVGGSVITDKTKRCTFNKERTVAIAKSLKTISGPMIIAHGTGSFGKPVAKDYDYMDGLVDVEKKEAIIKVEMLLSQLESLFIENFAKEGLPVIGVHPMALFYAEGNKIYPKNNLDIIVDLLERGLIPVLSGEFIIDKNGGYTVISSDVIAAELAVKLQAKQLVYAVDTPGVYRFLENGEKEVIKEFRAKDKVYLRKVPGDVSGGMLFKVEMGLYASENGVQTAILSGGDPNIVKEALESNIITGTKIIA